MKTKKTSNEEVGEYLSWFTKTEDRLAERLRLAGGSMDERPFYLKEWRQWIGDPARYINDLLEYVEVFEKGRREDVRVERRSSR